MDNNNSIPYGTISWDNEDSFSPTNQQRETQRIPSARNLNTLGSNQNGMRYSLRGPQFPPPQQRIEGVGLSRNLDLANQRQGQLQTLHSNLQQPSTSSSAPSRNIQYERFFSLRPVLNTPSHDVQMQSNSNPRNEGETFSHSYVNSLPGSSSNNPGTVSGLQFPNFLGPGTSVDNVYNKNIEMPQGETDVRSHDRFCSSRAKRKSSVTDNDEGQDGPSTKQFLSEERMAARMHKLRISNDHNYPVNIMQSFLDQFNAASQAAGSSESRIDNDDEEFENSTESTQERQDNLPAFVVHPEVKDAMNESRANLIIPEAIFKQLSKPCLAVIPWKSPEDRLSLSTESKPNHQDKNENGHSSSSSSTSNSSSSSCISLIMESCPEGDQFQDKGVHHVEIVGECGMFSLDNDEMEQ